MSVDTMMALATPIAIIAATILQQRALSKAASERQEVKESLAKAESSASQKLDTIHGLVNSEMSKALAQIRALTDEVAELKAQLILARRRPRK